MYAVSDFAVGAAAYDAIDHAVGVLKVARVSLRLATLSSVGHFFVLQALVIFRVP